MWESADPILGEYLPETPTKPSEIVKLMPPTAQRPIARFNLPHNGGVFTPANMGLYGYVGNDPINKVDPNGLSGFFANTPIYTAGEIYGEQNYEKIHAIEHQTELNSVPKDLEVAALGTGTAALAFFGQEELAVPLGRLTYGLSVASVGANIHAQGKFTASDALTLATATLALEAGPVAKRFTQNADIVNGIDFSAQTLDIGNGLHGLVDSKSDSSSNVLNRYNNSAHLRLAWPSVTAPNQ